MVSYHKLKFAETRKLLTSQKKYGTFQILTSRPSFGIRQEVVGEEWRVINECYNKLWTAVTRNLFPFLPIHMRALCPHPSPLFFFFSELRTGLGRETSLYDMKQCISKSELPLGGIPIKPGLWIYLIINGPTINNVVNCLNALQKCWLYTIITWRQ